MSASKITKATRRLCFKCRNSNGFLLKIDWEHRKIRKYTCETCASAVLDDILPAFGLYDSDPNIEAWQRAGAI